MSSRLGPLEVDCDAPPYTVVSACRELGLESPEDVRWQRVSRFHQRRETLTSIFGPGSWASLLGGRNGHDSKCSCGHALPALESCTFLFRSGKTKAYLLGQCGRCRTIFWEEA